MLKRSPSRGLTTSMFTDIVGSTAIAVELGDRRWHEVQAHHHRIVRRGLKRFHGHEVDTAGDGFFATFQTPADGVRCACAVAEAVRELGIEIRAGLHTGEAELSGEKAAGIAVTTAARVSAAAGPGEVLVTRTVADLVAGSGFGFSDQGEYELKGIPGTLHLFAVTAIDAQPLPPTLDPAEAADRRTRIVLPAVQGARRSRLLVVGVVVVLIAASLSFILDRTSQSAPLRGNGIQLIDPSSSKRVGSVSLPSAPSGIAWGGGFVWASEGQAGTVVKIDPATRQPVQTIQVGTDPAGITFADGAVWVAVSGEGIVARIDPTSYHVVDMKVGNGPTGIAASVSGIWVTNYSDDTVMRIDPTTDAVDKPVSVGSGPVGIAADALGAWVTNEGDGTVTRILSAGGTSPYRVGNGPSGIAIGPTGIWVANGLDGTLSRIDPGSGSVVTNPIGDGPAGVTVDGGTVWVSDRDGDAVARLDSGSGTADQVSLDASPVASVLAQGALWVASSASTSVHRGGTLRVSQSFAVDSLDPAVAY